MKKTIRIIASFCVVFLVSAAVPAKQTIGIIVNRNLYSSIQPKLDQYIEALQEIEGKNVWLNATTFTASSTKFALKDSIKARYENDSLEGVIFIGDLPLARYRNLNDFNGAATFVCDLYYMDLDGVWSPADLPTSHTGNKAPEIWLSRLTTSVLLSYANKTEAQIVNSYFDRVLRRMQGGDTMARKYLIAGDTREWPGLLNENRDTTCLDYSMANITSGSNLTVWKNGLIAGQEYGFVYSHSAATFHQLTPGYNIRAIYSDATKCRFYNSYACSNGNYAVANMVGAYATEDEGLICVGSAKTGSMVPGSFRAYNKPLGQEKDNFGAAYKKWWIERGINNVSWHYGMTLQGVGTLYLQPYSPTTVKPVAPAQKNSLQLTVSHSRIIFQIPATAHNADAQVTVRLYSINGARARTLLDKKISAGRQAVAFNSNGLAKGVYICRVTIDGMQESQRIVIK